VIFQQLISIGIQSKEYMTDKKVVACLELGGTSAAIAIADSLGSFLWKKKGIATGTSRDPSQVIEEICKELLNSGYKFDTLGIASFGPLNIKAGCIGLTPKPLWKHFPLVAELHKHLGESCKIILETDVNAPAYSEYLALKEKEPNVVSVAYMTIGTGVGLGVYSDGRPYHGVFHPEFGHSLLPPAPGDTYSGFCPYHHNCLEGLISCNALAERLGISIDQLPTVPNDDPVWDIFAYYIGVAAANAALAYSLDYFVIGGGVMTGDNRSFLFEKAQKYCDKFINNYIPTPKIVPPVYLKDAGLVGAAACGLYQSVFQ